MQDLLLVATLLQLSVTTPLPSLGLAMQLGLIGPLFATSLALPCNSLLQVLSHQSLQEII
jgi:hypothetical protein